MKNLFKSIFAIGMIALMAGNPPPGIAKDVGTVNVPYDNGIEKQFTADLITVENIAVENTGMWSFTNELTFQVNDMEVCLIERSWPAKAEHLTVIKLFQPDISWCAKELFIDPGLFICPVYRC